VVHLQNPGSYLVTAAYAGDSNDQASAPATLPVTVSAPAQAGFAMGASSTSAASPLVVPASGAGVVVTLTSINGFSSAVQLATSGLPAHLSARFTDMSGNAISTAVPSPGGTRVNLVFGYNSLAALTPHPVSPLDGPLALCGSLGGIVLAGTLLRRRRLSKYFACLGLAALMIGAGASMGGCGGARSGAVQVDSVTVTATPQSSSVAPSSVVVFIQPSVSGN
jgi:hypothetical protein